jgi:hypothetical protein
LKYVEYVLPNALRYLVTAVLWYVGCAKYWLKPPPEKETATSGTLYVPPTAVTYGPAPARQPRAHDGGDSDIHDEGNSGWNLTVFFPSFVLQSPEPTPSVGHEWGRIAGGRALRTIA